jgi:hypothetical protein
MNIGMAVEALKHDQHVARSGWNGKDMYLYLIGRQEGASRQGKWVTMLPFVMMVTAQGEHVPWLCSQTDLLAEDWQVVA